MLWMTTDAVALAAWTAAAAATDEALGHLRRAQATASELTARSGWHSPAATAFRASLADWSGWLEACVGRVALLGAEISAARQRAASGGVVG